MLNLFRKSGSAGNPDQPREKRSHSVFSRGNDPEHGGKRKFTRDERELARFGKVQRFKRNFGFLSITGLVTTLMQTWEAIFFVVGPQLINGGPAGAVGGFLFAWGGNMLQVLVMAEMASMIPLSGGQYNWVAVLAPESTRRFLSYMTGWITLIAWQCSAVALFFLSALAIQVMAAIAHPDYQPQRWQVTLMIYALMIFALYINTYLAKALPGIESSILVFHTIGFFIVLTVFVYLSPTKNPSSEVFGLWLNEGKWPTQGLSFMVGAVGSMFMFIGVDGGAHLAEEVSNASYVVPYTMIISVLLNGATGFAMLIAFLYSMGPVQNVVNDFLGGSLPFTTAFLFATGSSGGAVALILIPAIVQLGGSIGYVATASRTLWAFARENAIPGSKYISHVHPKFQLPLYSIGVTAGFVLILSLLEIGSEVAINAFTSLATQGFYGVYLISASSLLYKRLTTPRSDIRFGRFHLGPLGIPITILSLMYTVVGFFFAFWPPQVNPDVNRFNWSLVVYVGFVIIALVYWQFYARHTYQGPLIELPEEVVKQAQEARGSDSSSPDTSRSNSST